MRLRSLQNLLRSRCLFVVPFCEVILWQVFRRRWMHAIAARLIADLYLRRPNADAEVFSFLR